MEYALQLNMNQLLSVIRTLPVNEKSFLKTYIEKDISEDKKQNNITQLLLSGPTMSDEQYLSYQQTFIHLTRTQMTQKAQIYANQRIN